MPSGAVCRAMHDTPELLLLRRVVQRRDAELRRAHAAIAQALSEVARLAQDQVNLRSRLAKDQDEAADWEGPAAAAVLLHLASLRAGAKALDAAEANAEAAIAPLRAGIAHIEAGLDAARELVAEAERERRLAAFKVADREVQEYAVTRRYFFAG